MATIEYGIWSEMAGGIVEAGFYGDEGKAKAEQILNAAAKGTGDLAPDEAAACSVVTICPDHEDEPADGCTECSGETCERCGDTFDPNAEGADPDFPLCPACSRNNDDRVVI